MSTVAERIERLDERLFAEIEAQLPPSDRRNLLALHSAVAARRASFAYLEIGSFRGGSLQAVIRDARCDCVMSIDARTAVAPDEARGSWTYQDNTTAGMVAALARIPGADMSKLVTFEASTEEMTVARLPRRPDFCFIDGEHTDAAAMRDARFCAEALEGNGVIVFHDRDMVKDGIRGFLTESWGDVSHAMALDHQLFVVELGGLGILRTPVIERAIASRWHSVAWRLATAWRTSPRALFAVWSAMPSMDRAILATRRRFRRA